MNFEKIKKIEIYKLNSFYKFPVLSSFLFLLFLSFSFFKYYNALNLDKILNLKKKILKVSKEKLKEKENKFFLLKNEVNSSLRNLKSLYTYFPKDAINFVVSYKNIFILDYKYKTLRKKGFYKIVKGKISFLSNYENLKKYLSYLKKHGFYILDITLKKYKYNQNNISLACTLKFSFLKK